MTTRPHLASHMRIAALYLSAAPLLARAEGTAAVVEAGGGMLQVIFSLLLVALVLAGSLFMLKRLGAPRGTSASLLRVISGTAVGARERVVVVEVGETWLVLGVAPGQVSKLHELPRQAAPTTPDAALPNKDFATWLKHVVERRNAP